MSMRNAQGRDLSRDLDNYITGHYGEDQFKRGGRVSKHFNSRHPAVAAVACPVEGCAQPAGSPCVRARDGRAREGHGTETHVGRVNVYEYQQQQRDRQPQPTDADPTT